MLASFVNRLPNRLAQQITKFYFQVLTRNQRESHCMPELHQYKTMDVKILPALQDNYMYLIVDKTTKEAAIVDPVEPQSVLNAAAEHGVKLTKVLTTHHHWDHAGGNQQLVAMFPGLQVFGGDDRIDALTSKVQHNSSFNIGNLNVTTLFTPCHTAGHVCYFVTAPPTQAGDTQETAVFTGDTLFLGGCGKIFLMSSGDTLFLGGCGRFFEGNAAQMYQALIGILSVLPDDTKVFCGHEYTIQNLKFATFLEPDNPEVKKKMIWSMQKRQNMQPTVPSTIGDEKKYNPFMRVLLPQIQRTAANSNDPVFTMHALRAMRDNFCA